jgi:hypothetical protein
MSVPAECSVLSVRADTRCDARGDTPRFHYAAVMNRHTPMALQSTAQAISTESALR